MPTVSFICSTKTLSYYLSLPIPGHSRYITEIELLCKKDISKIEETVIKEMLRTCFKINHCQALTDLVIKLKRNNNVKLPDAIIAASAQLLQLPLITADKGFVNISKIDCFILDF